MHNNITHTHNFNSNSPHLSIQSQRRRSRRHLTLLASHLSIQSQRRRSRRHLQHPWQQNQPPSASRFKSIYKKADCWYVNQLWTAFKPDVAESAGVRQ